MGTRSRIGMLKKDGSVESIYCHYDGYLEGVGRILADHYRTEEKVVELLNLGNISCLGTTTQYKDYDKLSYSEYTSLPIEERQRYTKDYYRWRKEPIKKKISYNEKEYKYELGKMGEEYLYLYKEGKWYYIKNSECDFKEV